MSRKTVIYHNPRCSKSRQTLQLLEERGVQPEVVEYLKTPPDRAVLIRVLQLLGKSTRELMRKQETEYKASGADNPELSDDELIDLMRANPRLIERPIVITATGAAIGRPPESVLEILES